MKPVESSKEFVFPVIDGHVDLIYCLMRTSAGLPFSSIIDGPITSEMLSSGNVRVMVGALYCADQYNGPVTAAAHLKALHQNAQTLLSGLSPIRTKADLQNAFMSETPPGLLTLIENADCLLDSDIATWQAATGLVSVGLTHAGENRIGSGNAVKNPQGFTLAGRILIQKLEGLGIAIDVAHLADPCFWELADIFRGPLISSHTGFRHFCNIPRNLSTEQVECLMNRGGIIGVSVNPEMLALSQVAGRIEVAEQIDWLVQRFGDQQVAIGSDFGGFDMPSAGIEHPGKFQFLAHQLLSMGYPQSAVHNIMGNNWYRFYHLLLQVESKKTDGYDAERIPK